MTTALFEYGHTSIGSWNGAWSGTGNLYAKTVSLSKKQIQTLKENGIETKIGSKASFFYDFGDGWKAKVYMTIGYAKDFRKTMTRSKGFLGYDWMIDEILEHGKILTAEERKEEKE